MSRSYKKHAYCGDKKDKELKRLANHRVRQYLKRNPEVTLRPSQFKHLFESWEICDYGWLCEWEEYWNRQLEWYYDDHYKRYYREPTPPDPKEEYRNWYHYYKMK